jgi:hypothetical protein
MIRSGHLDGLTEEATALRASTWSMVITGGKRVSAGG